MPPRDYPVLYNGASTGADRAIVRERLGAVVAAPAAAFQDLYPSSGPPRRQRLPYELSQKSFFRLLGSLAADERHIVYDGGHFLPRTDLVAESMKWFDC